MASPPRHLLHVFSTFGMGGPQVRTCELINHFGSRYRHTLIAMDGNYACRERLKEGLNIRWIPLRIHKKEELKNLFLFRRLLQEIQPDLLLTYNWGAIEWSLVNHFFPICPQAHTEDGFGPDELITQKPWRIWIRRFFLSHAYKIIVPSKTLYRVALQTWRLSEKSVVYIPNGIDCEKYSKQVLSRKGSEWEFCRNSLVIGTVARLRKEKNLLRLLRVFSRLAPEFQAKLLIVGDGPEYPHLVRYIEENKLQEKVRLLGHREDPAEVLSLFDIFAISSDTEQMPISVLEAMAAGCPVVGTDVGDIKDMVSPENRAYIGPRSDEDFFRRMLEKLLKEAPLRAYLGEQNRIHCRRFFEKKWMFEAYEKVYEMKL
ncbi:MAG TPA: glycosyltransferase [Candidatus Limnocylindrales bacterium]|nr:glycosyltransferase [Candidatus Limnocylindrales bacterium]